MIQYIISSVGSQLKLERRCPHCNRYGWNTRFISNPGCNRVVFSRTYTSATSSTASVKPGHGNTRLLEEPSGCLAGRSDYCWRNSVYKG